MKDKIQKLVDKYEREVKVLTRDYRNELMSSTEYENEKRILNMIITDLKKL